MVETPEFKVNSSSFVSVLYQPVFKLPTAEITERLKLGADIELNCESHENPPASHVQWYFENKRMDYDSKSLAILDLNSKKKGRYKCLVGNSVGNSTKKFTVILMPKGEIKVVRRVIYASTLAITFWSLINFNMPHKL